MLQKNIKNRTIFCKDNLDLLRGMNTETIDLVYLDPPFNKNKTFTAPIGTSAEGASFKDIFKEEDVKEEWVKTFEEDNERLFDFLHSIKNTGNKYNFCYLCYMAIRLMEVHRILKETGSLYLHCDPTMSHYLKLLLDIIFEEENFRNEIVWSYKTGGSSSRYFSKKHDIILCFTKNKKKSFFSPLTEKSYTKSKNRKEGKINYGGGTAEFFEDEKGVYNFVNMRDVWEISYIGSTHAERTGYPTQKPLALLDRIIRASSNKGDIVLDPFCGCATTCIASEILGRKWVGIDVSIEAYNLVKKRLKKEVKPDLHEPEKEVNFSTDVPIRTDIGENYQEKKWVYVISNPAYKGEYKVGIAKDWQAYWLLLETLIVTKQTDFRILTSLAILA